MNNQQTTDTQDQSFGQRSRGGCGGPFSRMFSGSYKGRGNWGKFAGSFANRKAANIEESETYFTISLYAAGLVKSNFKISVSEDVISIAYHAPENMQASQYTYQEYEPGSFERSFRLNGKVLTDHISAAYTDGVLFVTLPKNPETNKPAKEVGVN